MSDIFNHLHQKEIHQAAGITFDGFGNFILASSKSAHSLLVFFADGRPMCQVEVTGLTHSATPDQIIRPADLRIMTDGTLFVASVTRHEVYKFYISED